MVETSKRQARSYRQFCALARALDMVGDRWNLLIVRELLPGPLRFNELKMSLTGVATNLLSERLRTLEENGIVDRRLGDAGVLYALTSWGAELRKPMEELGRWGTPLLASGRGSDSFQPRWLTLALPAMLRNKTAKPALEVGFEVEGQLLVLQIDDKGPSVGTRPDQEPETVLTASAETVVSLVAGALTVEQAVAEGQIRGDMTVLRRAFAEEFTSSSPNS